MANLLVLGKWFLITVLTFFNEENTTGQSGSGSFTWGVLSLQME